MTGPVKCYLIERSQPEGVDPPQYWVKWKNWTTDASKAARFYDGEPIGGGLLGRERAQDIATNLHPLPPPHDKPYCRVVEHIFINNIEPMLPLTHPSGRCPVSPQDAETRADRVARIYDAKTVGEFTAALKAFYSPATAKLFTPRAASPDTTISEAK